MHSLQLVVMEDAQVNAGMQGDFDLSHDEFSLVMTAEGMQVARAQAGSRTDRVLAQLRMPVMDGFHFLSYLASRHFELSIVLGSVMDFSPRQHYLLATRPPSQSSPPTSREPRALPGLASLPRPPRALRHGVTLLDFFRFCVEERQTRMLEVSQGGRTAIFHLTLGKLFHARCGEREGVAVFLEVMSWNTPSLRILPTLPSLHTTITTEMDLLLRQAEVVQERREPALPPQGQPGEETCAPSSSALGILPSMMQRVASWASRLSVRRWWEALPL